MRTMLPGRSLPGLHRVDVGAASDVAADLPEPAPPGPRIGFGRRLRILHVVGTRPNFVKIAPLLAACRRAGSIESVLVHTGQHHDAKMSGRFFRDLEIPAPDVDLEAGAGGSHAVQTARIMTAFERVAVERRPDAVVVVGDVNSTLACALVAAKLGIPLVHVEAGLRSRDRAMPEEINRVVTDAMADLLFCTEPAGVDNLLREGIDRNRIFLVGNLLADTLFRERARAAASPILDTLGLAAGQYALVTLHRPANVDDESVLAGLLDAVEAIARVLPVVLPAHPRLRAALAACGFEARRAAGGGLRFVDPLGYLDCLRLMRDARLCLTDSGGIQEETTILGVPCLTLRDNTERPLTVDAGTNRLVGRDPDAIVAAFHDTLAQPPDAPDGPPRYWDGRTAGRIVSILASRLEVRP